MEEWRDREMLINVWEVQGVILNLEKNNEAHMRKNTELLF